MPRDLERYLHACLAEALRAGAQVAWLAFEGSFDLHHLLTDDIATEVYGVGDTQGIAVVLLDEEIRSDEWLGHVRAVRATLSVDDR